MFVSCFGFSVVLVSHPPSLPSIVFWFVVMAMNNTDRELESAGELMMPELGRHDATFVSLFFKTFYVTMAFRALFRVLFSGAF